MLCSFKKVAAPSSSQHLTAKCLGPMQLVAGHGKEVARARKNQFFLFGKLQPVVLHFPLDAYEKIEMHAFSFEPAFEGFAGVGAELDEHFPFKHVEENALGASGAAGLHSLCESFSPLPREAGQRVLGKVAWHRNSWKRMGV